MTRSMRSYSLAALAALALTSVAGVARADSIDATAIARQLLGAAVVVPNGDYVVSNVDDSSAALTYNDNSGRNLFPTVAGNGSPITFGKVDGSLMYIEAEGQKCLSAQWTGSSDGIAVLYACAIGANKNNDGDLRLAKQKWLLIPVGNKVASVNGKSAAAVKPGSNKKSASKKKASSKKPAKKTAKKATKKASSSKKITPSSGRKLSGKLGTSSSSAGKKCTKSAKYIKRHPRYVKHHPECKSLAKRDASMLDRRSVYAVAPAPVVSLNKRGGAGPFFICTLDHLTDMVTRCLTNRKANAAGGSDQLGVVLADMDTSDKAQMWTFNSA